MDTVDVRVLELEDGIWLRVKINKNTKVKVLENGDLLIMLNGDEEE